MMNVKDIVIVADFCSAFDGKGNNRFIYIAEHLIAKGHSVEIVTSDFCHSDKRPFCPTISDYHGIKITMLHEPQYSKNISIKRFYAHYLWGRQVYNYLRKRSKPCVVYCAMPSLNAARLSGKYCKKNSVKFVVDIQDLWPEAFKMVFNIPVLSDVLFAPFNLIANSAYKSADEIVAVSKTYVDRALKVNRKNIKGHPVFLGTDLETFDTNVINGKRFKKDDSEVWLGYCGSLAYSYNLKVVFDAMRKFDNPHLKFIIMGAGPRENEFKSYSKGLNTFFTGRLPYKDMCAVLDECDIVVNPIAKNAAQSIINKHADYAASGKPVISTQKCREYEDLVTKYEMGVNVSNVDDFCIALKRLCNDANLRRKMGSNSRRCAEELFDRKKTYNIIRDLILKDNGNE